MTTFSVGPSFAVTTGLPRLGNSPLRVRHQSLTDQKSRFRIAHSRYRPRCSVDTSTAAPKSTTETATEQEVHNVVIIGSGPAGYTSAIYTGRAFLKPIVLEGFNSGVAGGQLMTTHIVENWPGTLSITGPELMNQMRTQAERWGAQMITDDCVSIDVSSRPYSVRTVNSGTLLCNSIIIATGASAKRLRIPGEESLWSTGISACAICDGAAPVFQGVPLAVVGGGDSACEEAIYLTKYASEVHLLVRSDKLRASKTLQDRAKAHPKVHIHYETSAIEALGGAGSGEDGMGGSPLRGVRIRENVDGKRVERELKCRGLFYAIGHTANTNFLNGSGVLLTEGGQVATRVPGSPETHVDGVFVAGDVADAEYRQAVTAAGSGCQAAIAAERWLAERGLMVEYAPSPDDNMSSTTGERTREEPEKKVADNAATFDEDETWHVGQFALRKLYHSSKRPLIVKYISPGCGPCSQLKPLLNAVITEFESTVHYVEIDITEDPEIAEAAGVTGTPMVQIFYEKSLMNTFRGVKMKSEFRRAIRETLAESVKSS